MTLLANTIDQHTNAVRRLIDIVTSRPVLAHPDPTIPFELEVDASNYATGAILFQRDPCGKIRPIGYHSKTFSDAERNYDIYDKELTAIDKGLDNWRHLLLGNTVIIHTDHANLTYYRHPHKLSDRARRTLNRILKYNVTIKHKPGIQNRADALSRQPDYPVHVPIADEVGLPDRLFANTTSALDLDASIIKEQNQHPNDITQLHEQYPLLHSDNGWTINNKLVVVGNDSFKRGVISLYHDFPTAGHPGGRKTLTMIARDYWWPTIRNDVVHFIKGCATCQATKPRLNQPKPPIFPITNTPYTLPFETIALDFIVKLPNSDGFDTILTITDQGLSKAAIFIPCQEAIDAEGVAQLYAQQVFPHYGIPKKVISDRDVRFTAKFTKELCRTLGIQQNLSTAYHPQTDGQSERTNQWLEQYLRIYVDSSQRNWNRWLPIAQYVHNAWPSDTTGQTPFELIMGFTPKAHQASRDHQLPSIKERSAHIDKLRWLAQKAIKHAQEIVADRRGKKYIPYKRGDKVWLEATNLTTTHPTSKLAPRRYGPMTITNVISKVVFQLALPPHWKIHNVFHASLLTPYHETPIHGPNYPEPPPEIVNGEEEWEVEEIMGSRRTGRRKELQYRVRWKGYSDSHDSWEPAGNINAPELIEAFHKKNLGRDKRIETDDGHSPPHISSITLHPRAIRMTDASPTHPTPPNATPPPLPSLPPSPTIAQVMLTMAEDQNLDVAQTRVDLMTHELQRDLEPESPSEEQDPLDDYIYAPRSPTPEHSPEDVHPRGPIQLGTEPIPPPLPHHLLRDEPNHPGWPFMARDRYPESASINPVIDSRGTLGILNYTRLSINRISGEPISVVTEGLDQPQYAGNLYARPVPPADSEKWPIPEGHWETSPLGEQTALDPVLNRALWTIKDAGIWADVFRYRYEDGRQREFRAWESRVNKLERFAEQERRAYSTAREESL